jgi:hypothetical protein
MKDYIDSRELQEMKEQLAILTQKLEKETIVNEQLIRQSMKDKASSIRRVAIVESIITLVMIPYLICVMPEVGGISTSLCYFACFFMILALVCNYYIHSRFRPDKFTKGNLLEVRKDTLTMKRFYINWLKFIGLPFIIVFFCWFIHDIRLAYPGENLNGIYGGMGFGILLGTIIGSIQFKKIQNTANEILEQIEDMKV